MAMKLGPQRRFRKDGCDEFSHLRIGQEVPSEWLGDYDIDDSEVLSGKLPSANLSRATALSAVTCTRRRGSRHSKDDLRRSLRIKTKDLVASEVSTIFQMGENLSIRIIRNCKKSLKKNVRVWNGLNKTHFWISTRLPARVGANCRRRKEHDKESREHAGAASGVCFQRVVNVFDLHGGYPLRKTTACTLSIRRKYRAG